jgi:flagellar hook assembly protein FlgD
MTGDSIFVNDVNAAIPLEAGEYHIYTDVRLNTPDLTVNNIRVDKVSDNLSATVYPNPFSSSVIVSYQVPKEGKTFVRIFDLNGKLIKQLVSENLVSGEYLIDWDGKSENGSAIPAGNYFLTVQQGEKIISKQIVKID